MPNFRFSALRRPRLHPREGVEQPALTLILAPAGYGKSTLVAQWVNDGVLDSMVVRWIRCRPEPSDKKETGSSLKASESLFWLSVCDALDIEPKGSAHDSVIRAVDKLEHPTMIVLDDYENVTSPHLDMELLTLLRSDSHLFVTVISRCTSLLDGPLVSSQTTVAAIGADDLMFTEEEIGELAVQQGLSVAAAARIKSSMAIGWPLAVSAALQGAA